MADFVLLALVCLVRVAPVFRGRVPFASDVVLQFPAWESVRGPGFRVVRHAEVGDGITEYYPWRRMIAESWRSGKAPSWNASIQCGAPLLSTGISGPFDLLELPYLVLPAPWAWTLALYLEALIAALGAWALAVRFGASRAGALFSGIVFALGGAMTAFQGWPQEHVLMWAPLLILALDRVAEHPSPARAAALAISLALVISGGHPETALYATLLASSFFVARRWVSGALGFPGEAAWRRAALGLAAGLALAGVTVVPFACWLPLLARTLAARFAPLHLADIAGFVCRDLRSNPAWGGPVPEGAVYCGMASLVLAPMALLPTGVRRRRALLLWALFLVMTAVSFGFPGTQRLWGILPVLSGLRPARCLCFAALMLALLAGLGLTALQRAVECFRRTVAAWSVSIGAAVLLLGVAAWHAEMAPWRRRMLAQAGPLGGPMASGVFLAAAAGLSALRVSGRLKKGALGRGAVVLIVADLGTSAWGFLPPTRPSEIFPPSPAMAFLARHTPPDQRVACVDGSVHPNFFGLYGLRSSDGYGYLLKRPRRFLSAMSGEPQTAFAIALDAQTLLRAPLALLDLTGTRYLVATTRNAGAEALGRSARFVLAFSDAGVRIFENRSALPGAVVVPEAGVRASADDGQTLAKMSEPGFDPRAGAFVAASWRAAPAPPGRVPAGRGGGAVTYRRESPGEIAVGVRGAEEGLLVVNEACAPGWGATVDGRRARVVRADVMFLGVPLPAGDHEVVLRYRPPGIRRGALLSLAGVICVAALWSLGRRSRRREIA